MGSVPCKVARKLPKGRPGAPTADPRVPATATAGPARRPVKPPLAFENKNETIEGDAKDPYLLEKLNQLGPVRVDHHMQTVRAARSDVQDMYRSRMRSEAEASSLQSVKNRLLASSLAELLEARKTAADRAKLETLAKRYHMDAAKLEQLSRVVNTPSIDESTVVRTTDEHGEESLTMVAYWVKPVLDRA